MGGADGYHRGVFHLLVMVGGIDFVVVECVGVGYESTLGYSAFGGIHA